VLEDKLGVRARANNPWHALRAPFASIHSH